MGVKGLFAFIKKKGLYRDGSDVVRFRGETIGIDVSILIYKWTEVGISRGIVNAEGRPINHIQGIVYHVMLMLRLGIHPVYIFDGKAPEIKANTITNRKKNRGQSTTMVKVDVYAEVIEILRLLKIPIVMSPGEADAQGALMCKMGLIDSFASDDSDAIAFGSPVVIRGLNGSSKQIEIYTLDDILSGLDMTYPHFVMICSMSGNDYTSGVAGYGLDRSYKWIVDHGGNRLPQTNEVVKDSIWRCYHNFLNPTASKLNRRPKHTKLTPNDIRAFNQHMQGIGIAYKKLTNIIEFFTRININTI